MGILKNRRHETYIQGIVSGQKQYDAYVKAYPSAEKWKRCVVDSKASTLFHREDVQARYQELMEQAAKRAVMSRTRKRVILATIAENPLETASDRIKAIDTDNRMEGEYTQKLNVDADANLNIVIDYGDDASGD